MWRPTRCFKFLFLFEINSILSIKTPDKNDQDIANIWKHLLLHKKYYWYKSQIKHIGSFFNFKILAYAAEI